MRSRRGSSAASSRREASFLLLLRMPAPHLYEHSHNQINRPVYPLCGSVPDVLFPADFTRLRASFVFASVTSKRRVTPDPFVRQYPSPPCILLSSQQSFHLSRGAPTIPLPETTSPSSPHLLPNLVHRSCKLSSGNSHHVAISLYLPDTFPRSSRCTQYSATSFGRLPAFISRALMPSRVIGRAAYSALHPGAWPRRSGPLNAPFRFLEHSDYLHSLLTLANHCRRIYRPAHLLR